MAINSGASGPPEVWDTYSTHVIHFKCISSVVAVIGAR